VYVEYININAIQKCKLAEKLCVHNYNTALLYYISSAGEKYPLLRIQKYCISVGFSNWLEGLSCSRPLHTSAGTVISQIFAIIRVCGLVARVLGYRSGGQGSIPVTSRKRM
jgi:hypothetical protein